jgi:hypothetical protein
MGSSSNEEQSLAQLARMKEGGVWRYVRDRSWPFATMCLFIFCRFGDSLTRFWLGVIGSLLCGLVCAYGMWCAHMWGYRKVMKGRVIPD